MADIMRVPRLDGNPWHITGYCDLGDLQYSPPEHEIVDHHIWQARDGKWQIWACVRGSRIGRLFFGWEGDALTQSNWRPLGVTMRVDRSYGESINDWNGEEWLQSPFVVQHEGLYHMLYGGHNTELGVSQMCLATSADGKSFQRHKNGQGQSRVFVGPGQTRDPALLKIGDEWVCYYCANDNGARRPGKVFARTSRDLVSWSAERVVSWGGFTSGASTWSTECPFVLSVDGYYYLFRTSEYRSPARTHVYRSTDPFDFGLGNDSKWITTLRLAAPEAVKFGDQWFISSVEDLQGGVQLFRLAWV